MGGQDGAANLKAAALLSLALLAFAGCSRAVDPVKAVEDARELSAAGKQGEARILLKKALLKDSSAIEARVLLARLALDSGDARAADQELSALDRAQLEAAGGEALELRLAVDLALGRAAQVLAFLDNAKERLGDESRAILRARALQALGRPADALIELRALASSAPENSKLAVTLAQTLAATGNLQQAERELSAFLERHPSDADALQARGEIRFRGGAAKQAIEDLQAALSKAPPSWAPINRTVAEILIGEAALASGNADLARAQVAKLEKVSPGLARTRLIRAHLALLDGRYGEAIDDLQQVVESMPDNAGPQYLLIDALLRSGNTVRATELLERRLAADPSDAFARRQLARVLLSQNKPDRVVQLFGELPTEGVQRDSEADELLSVARLAQERASAAITELRAQLDAKPGDLELRVKLAAAYLANGQPRQALNLVEDQRASGRADVDSTILSAFLALGNELQANRFTKELVDSVTRPIESLLSAAEAAQQSGHRDIAERLIDRALEREPQNARALMQRASLRFAAQRYDEARSTLEELQRANPNDPSVKLALARVVEASGDVAGARSALQAAFKAAPADLNGGLALAGLELRQGRYAEANAVLDKMIAASPKDGVAANAAGLLLIKAGRFDEGRTRFRDAIEQNPRQASYWANLGRAQLAARDPSAARESFTNAVRLQPEWLDANIAAIRLSLQMGDRASARQLTDALSKRVADHPIVALLEGEVALAEGRAENAASAFGRSYALRPSALAATREHQARVASRSVRAEQPLLNWLAHRPSDTAVRRQLADYYLTRGNEKEATEQFELLLKHNSNDVVSLNNLAWLLATKDVARAELLARRAHAIAPDDPALADTLGWVLIKANKYDEARRMLAHAVDKLPDNPTVRFHYALALARAGDTSEARQNLQAVLAGNRAFDKRAEALQLAKELGI